MLHKAILFVGMTYAFPFLGYSQNLSADQASSILKSTTPLLEPWIKLGATDPDERKAAEKLYDSQIIAITVLATTKDASVSALLIPYLDYPAKGYSPARFLSLADATEDIEVTRSHWPAFSALLELPGSTQALIVYVLNSNNPIRFRVAALHVLRYKDPVKFKETVSSFRLGFPHLGPNANAYLQSIEDGSRAYWGAFPFDPTK
jgi:hypothetical protein